MPRISFLPNNLSVFPYAVFLFNDEVLNILSVKFKELYEVVPCYRFRAGVGSLAPVPALLFVVNDVFWHICKIIPLDYLNTNIMPLLLIINYLALFSPLPQGVICSQCSQSSPCVQKLFSPSSSTALTEETISPHWIECDTVKAWDEGGQSKKRGCNLPIIQNVYFCGQ